MEYQATSKYLRISTRKMRLVADAVRSLPVGKALIALTVMPKAGAPMLAKVVKSALSNAKQKGADTDQLHFVTIEVMGGPSLKRYQAVSRGMGHSYKHRMTHVRVILGEKEQKPMKKADSKGVK